MAEVREAARKYGLEVKLLEIRRAEDIRAAFEALGNEAQAPKRTLASNWE